MASIIHSPIDTDKDETRLIVSQCRGLTHGVGSSPELFIVFLDVLLGRLKFLSEALGPPKYLVTAFEDDIKAHTDSILNLGIVTMIFNEWKDPLVGDMPSFAPKFFAFSHHKTSQLSSLPECAVGMLPSSYQREPLIEACL